LPAALPAEEKRIRTTLAPTLALVVAISTVVYIFLGTRNGATLRSMRTYGLVMAVYVAYLLLWAPRRTKRRLRRCWDTYSLEVGPDYLLRRQADLQEVRVPFHEVQAVEQVPGRYLRVIGTPKSRAISIPEGIEDFKEVFATISSIHAVEVRRIQDWQKNRLSLVAGLLLYSTMLWVTLPVVVIPLSLIVGSIIVWLFFWIRRNPNFPNRNKWLAWYFLLFLGICAMKLLVAVTSYLPQRPTR
jgi:hypothetical protein